MDGLQDSDTAPKPTLIYPFEGPPARGQALEVAPGVHWIRMPLPYALNHINLWTLDDGEGWAIVDTGVRNEETALVWRELFANSPDERPLTRVFVTHMHPDHVGMAGWMTRKFGVRLWMTRLEYLTCRVMVSDTGREAPDDAIEFFHRAGWGAAAIETYRARFGNFGKHIHALPDSYRRLHDGEELRIGANTWRVVVGSGHSPEHACLYCPDLKVLISGDQILPRISSNVSVHPDRTRRRSDEQLAGIARQAPARGARRRAGAAGAQRVLPRPARAHRCTGTGAGDVAQTIAPIAREPKRVIDVFSALFARPIAEADVPLLGMATGEAVACLNHLMHRGEVTRSLDSDGVAWYRLDGEPKVSSTSSPIHYTRIYRKHQNNSFHVIHRFPQDGCQPTSGSTTSRLP